VLLGDRDQLASVEAGAVLADLCGDAAGEGHGSGLARCVTVLEHSYRHAAGSSIRALAEAIRAGDADSALALLADGRHADVSLVEPAPRGPGTALCDEALEGYRGLFRARDPLERLHALERFRVLCAHQRGASGVEGVNRAVEAALRGAGVIGAAGEGDYAGKPLGIARNDYALELFNGDVGVLDEPPAELSGGAVPGLLAAFRSADGSVRWIAPARLPAHEPVYAISVHKSQGSEYDAVSIALPELDSPLLSRELLYTAVTRARERVRLHARPDLIRQAIGRRVRRASGLGARLWGAS
jgi:exodeoxyribonuclease V alpha subunit